MSPAGRICKRRSSRPAAVERELLEELQGGLCALIGLGEHGGAGLNEGVEAGELSGFRRDIDIDDAAVGGFEIGLVGGEKFVGDAEAALGRAVLSTESGDVLQR